MAKGPPTSGIGVVDTGNCTKGTTVLDVLTQCGPQVRDQMRKLGGAGWEPTDLVFVCALSGYTEPGNGKPFVYEVKGTMADGSCRTLVLKTGAATAGLKREIENCGKMGSRAIQGRGLPQVFLAGKGCCVTDKDGKEWGLTLYAHAGEHMDGGLRSLHDWLAESLRKPSWNGCRATYYTALTDLSRDWACIFSPGLGPGASGWRIQSGPCDEWAIRIRTAIRATAPQFTCQTLAQQWGESLRRAGVAPPTWERLVESAECAGVERLVGALHGDLHAKNIVVVASGPAGGIRGGGVFSFDYEDLRDGSDDSAGPVLWDVVKLQVELLVHLATEQVSHMLGSKQWFDPGSHSALDYLCYLCQRFVFSDLIAARSVPAPALPKGWDSTHTDNLLEAVEAVRQEGMEQCRPYYSSNRPIFAKDYLATLLQYCLYRGKYENQQADSPSHCRLSMSYLLAVFAARAIRAGGDGVGGQGPAPSRIATRPTCATLREVGNEFRNLLSPDQREALCMADGYVLKYGNKRATEVLVRLMERLDATLAGNSVAAQGTEGDVGDPSLLWTKLSRRLAELSRLQSAASDALGGGTSAKRRRVALITVLEALLRCLGDVTGVTHASPKRKPIG